MSLPRFFISDLDCDALREPGSLFELTGEDYHHAAKALRLGLGEKLVLSNGKGKDCICAISELGAKTMLLKPLSIEENPSEAGPEIILWQGLPKGSKFEHIIEKTVELGVTRLVPLKTLRSLIKLDDKTARNKQLRWQNIAEAAAKQSGRGIVPEVSSPCSLADALAEVQADLEMGESIAFIPWEEATEPYLPHYLESAKSATPTFKRIHFFIGPEGGLAASEVESAAAVGVKPITLGKRILRTETAGPAVLAMLNVLLPDKML